jgi:hypothetical protein
MQLSLSGERIGHDINRSLFEMARSSELTQQLFTRTLNHPELGHIITWMPTAWLLARANPNPLSYTNTAGADGLPDRNVDMSVLFQNLLEQGMRDPLLVGIGLNDGYVRLETGNQRIRCFSECGVDFVPAVGFVNDTAVTHEANGPHQGLPIGHGVDTAYLVANYQQYVCLAEVLPREIVFG